MSCNPVDPEQVAILKAFDKFKSSTESESEPEPPKEMVNHPFHYSQFSFEPIDVIEDWKLGFNLGNALKYLSRIDTKGNPIQDLKKSIWYLQRELATRQK